MAFQSKAKGVVCAGFSVVENLAELWKPPSQALRGQRQAIDEKQLRKRETKMNKR
jgi:hypothetical protein